MRRLLVLSLLSSLMVVPRVIAEDVLDRAMRDELARSVEKLRMEGLDKPYFIAYRVMDRSGQNVGATFGSLIARSQFHSRFLAVELRVGQYTLDNTNFISSASFGRRPAGTTLLPLDDDYNELSRHIWLATDAAYKSALEELSQKRAFLKNKNRTQEVPDLTQEEALKTSDVIPFLPVDLTSAETLVRDLSMLFREMPDVFNSSVHFNATVTDVRYLNSEGTSFHYSRPWTTLSVQASTQAPDGMPLDDSLAVYAHSFRELPAKQEMVARIRDFGGHLKQLRSSPTVELYDGPVLVEGQAAAQLFAQVFAPKLLAGHPVLADNPQFERATQGDSFIDRIGSRVLASFLSVKDNPSLDRMEGKTLFGGYKVDDDGVKPRETVVVENGILKSLLSTRNPARGITHSTANRRGNGPAPSNLIVLASQSVTADKLRSQLLEIVKQRGKEYGILVRQVQGSGATTVASGGPAGTSRVSNLVSVYRVFADNHEELVRNLEFADISPASFKDVLAVSESAEVYTAPFVYRTMAGGFSPLDTTPMVSWVVPSMLFEDLPMKTPTGEFPNPPVAKHPYFDKNKSGD
jgi:predicted Zn-dependent protease